MNDSAPRKQKSTDFFLPFQAKKLHQISNINLPEESVELTKELALKKNKVDNLRKRLNT
jgi:hypothetical protein